MRTRYRGHPVIAGAEIGWRVPDLNLAAMNLECACRAIDQVEGKTP